MTRSILRMATAAAAALSLAAPAQAAQQYTLDKKYDYTNFFTEFDFISTDDLSNGYVDYQNKTAAFASGLANITSDNKILLGADSKLIPSDSARGRQSVRVEGKDNFTHGLIVADFSHLPAPKCGVWPAFWMYAEPWPTYGEFDIFEMYNLQDANTVTLHTTHAATVGTCKLEQGNMTGTVSSSSNCDNYYENGSLQYLGQGCGVVEDSNNNPFPDSGSNSGGIYATEWTDTYIKVWSWRHGSEPSNLYSAHPDPSTWGTPRSYVGTPNCNIDSVISNQHLVLNIDFCGDAAGNNFGTCSALNTNYTASPTGCAAYVQSHPSEFVDSYFEVSSIKIFQEQTIASNTTSTSSTVSSTSTSTSTSTLSTATTVTTTHLVNSTVSTVSTVSTTAHAAATVAANSTVSGGNVVAAAAVVTSTGAAGAASGYTTSTVYSTLVSTIYSCAPTVTNCPYGKVTTVVYAVTTTVCPVTASSAAASSAAASNGTYAIPASKAATTGATVTTITGATAGASTGSGKGSSGSTVTGGAAATTITGGSGSGSTASGFTTKTAVVSVVVVPVTSSAKAVVTKFAGAGTGTASAGFVVTTNGTYTTTGSKPTATMAVTAGAAASSASIVLLTAALLAAIAL